MKWLFIFTCLVYFSCGNHSSSALSADQQGLFNMSGDFRKDYKDTADSKERERFIDQYQIKLQDYLMHVCSSRMENMHVQMKKFEEDPNGRIYAQFADQNCEYVFQKVYDSGAQMKADTIYRFVKSLQPNNDITVRFLFAGNVKISVPGAESANTFRIEVIPTGGES